MKTVKNILVWICTIAFVISAIAAMSWFDLKTYELFENSASNVCIRGD